MVFTKLQHNKLVAEKMNLFGLQKDPGLRRDASSQGAIRRLKGRCGLQNLGYRKTLFIRQDIFNVCRSLGKAGNCRDYTLFSGQKLFPGKKRLGATPWTGWIARSVSDWSSLPRLRERWGGGVERKRALSNSPCKRRCGQATSGVAMAANATTNPSQLLPLGNRGVGDRGVPS